MAKLAIVLGGASCVWDDLKNLRELCEPDLAVAANDIGTVYPHELHHWASYHAAFFSKWVAQRRRNGLPGRPTLWTGNKRPRDVPTDIKTFDLFGGSSGLLATCIAMQFAEKVVLVGIPLDPGMVHYHNRDRGKPWKDGKSYQKHWQKIKPKLDCVRSMSGWTRDLLGRPTAEWLKGEGHDIL